MSKILAQTLFSDVTLLPNGLVKKQVWSNKKGLVNLFEVEILLNAYHPNLIGARGVDFTHQATIIYLNCAEFDLLDGVFKNLDSLTRPEILLYMYQAGLALMALHVENILHLDFKPENILIFREGDKRIARLADLGFARHTDPKKKLLTSILGTPLYFSPEIMDSAVKKQRVCFTPADDVWAFGFSLFILMTKEENYDLTDEGEIFKLVGLEKKTNNLFLSETSFEYIDSKINDTDISYLISKILTKLEDRWDIEDVIDYMKPLIKEENRQNFHPLILIPRFKVPEDIGKEIKKLTDINGYDYDLFLPWLERIPWSETYDLNILIYCLLEYVGLSDDLSYYIIRNDMKMIPRTFKRKQAATLEKIYMTRIVSNVNVTDHEEVDDMNNSLRMLKVV